MRHPFHRLPRLLSFCLVLVMALAACGGASDEPSLNELLEAAGAGVDLEIDGDNNFSTNLGGASVGMGTDLERPDWLDSSIQLPEGLAISIAINDPSTGERSIQGVIENGDAVAIANQQKTMLEAQGYEALQDSGFYVQAGRPSLQVDAADMGNGSVAYRYEHSFETEQTLRDIYAPVEGRGTLTASINDQVLTFEGTCSLRSSSGQFSSDDAQANFTVDVREGEQDYILGNITSLSGETFESWMVLQVDENGEFPSISMQPTGFQFDGSMVDINFSNPSPATIEVTCPS